MSAAQARANRAPLWDEGEYRREVVFSTVGRTGLTMTAEQVAMETGLGPEAAAELDRLAECGAIGRVGDRFFPLKWAVARRSA